LYEAATVRGRARGISTDTECVRLLSSTLAIYVA
jgi:hypothetical protein